jgi:DNA uptake protein ComE-like DNA-binding protein
MSRHRSSFVITLVIVIAAFTLGARLNGQVGKGTIVDVNTAAEKTLLTLPHMTPDLVKVLLEKRPFASIAELDTLLTSRSLTRAQLTEFYGKAFVHVNLNTAPSAEILLIPGAGNRMAHEFSEYRPWKTWAQFDKEISKYVGQAETNRLKQYVFIPVRLNTATDQDMLSIPGVGARMVHEFKEYRPWKTKEQFEKEIGKYVSAREVARLWRYVTIQ